MFHVKHREENEGAAPDVARGQSADTCGCDEGDCASAFCAEHGQVADSAAPGVARGQVADARATGVARGRPARATGVARARLARAAGRPRDAASARLLARAARWARGEAVLCVAAVCALVSAAFVPPDAAYASYFDTRVLILLFCLMATVAGCKASGLFDVLAKALLQGDRPFRVVALILVMLPFFASMLVTNDVALLAFVPFSVLVLGHAGRTRSLAWVIVLQAVAANLGGMATPVGNPQNLYLFTRYHVGLGEFAAVLLPYVALAFVLLTGAALASGGGRAKVEVPLASNRVARGRALLHIALFALCLLAVARVVEPVALLVAVGAVLALFDRPVLRAVDYGLLLTFACFFVFVGNMGRIEEVRHAFEGLMNANALLTSVAASQVISNVPAAVLLSEFTGDWRSLLVGVDVGGLGTPVASLASLIALRIYLHADGANFGTFMVVFAAVNTAFLAAMLALCAAIG